MIPGLGRSAGEGIGYPLLYSWAFLVAQLVKNLPAMEAVWFLGWEDPLEKRKATHSSILARRNSNKLRYADDTTLMAESEEELKSLLIKVKEESEKAGLKLNIQKMKIMASGPITSWQIDGETMETVTDYFLGLQNHCRQ